MPAKASVDDAGSSITHKTTLSKLPPTATSAPALWLPSVPPSLPPTNVPSVAPTVYAVIILPRAFGLLSCGTVCAMTACATRKACCRRAGTLLQ